MASRTVWMWTAFLVMGLMTGAFGATATTWTGADTPRDVPSLPPAVSSSAGTTSAGPRDVGVEDWKSANLAVLPQLVLADDFDADGTIEILVLAYDTTLGQSFIYLFDAVNHNQEWKSAAITGDFLWYEISQTDGDAANELTALTRDWTTNTVTVRLFDLATHKEYFTGPGTAWDCLTYPTVDDVDNDKQTEIVFVEVTDLGSSACGGGFPGGGGGGGNGGAADKTLAPAADADGSDPGRPCDPKICGGGGGQTATNASIVIYDPGNGVTEWRGPLLTNWVGMQVGEADGDIPQEIVVSTYDQVLVNDTGALTVFDGALHTQDLVFTGLQYVDPSLNGGRLVLADLDGDADGDILFRDLNTTDWTAGLHAREGASGTTLWDRASDAFQLTVADIDGDGTREVAYLAGTGAVEVVTGSTGANEYTSALAGTAVRVDYGDYDGDGSPDLLIVDDNAGTQALVLIDAGTYTQTWTTGAKYPWISEFPTSKPRDTEIVRRADIDGDLSDELVFRTTDWSQWPAVDKMVIITASNGTEEWKSAALGQGSPASFDLAFFPAAGRWLLAVAEYDDSTQIGSLRLFDGATHATLWTSADNDARGVIAVDVDGDATPELLAWSFTDGNVGAATGHLFLFSVDWAPDLVGPVPDITLPEDTDLLHARKLSDYFTDDRDAATLTYTVSYQEDPSHVAAAIDGEYLDITTPIQDWNGASKVRVTAKDGQNQLVESADFTVTVTPVNDAPVIGPVADQALTEGVAFSLQLTATDADGEAATWTCDAALFPVDPATGLMAMTPTNADIGVHWANVTATDPSGGVTTLQIRFTVANVNQPPALDLPGVPIMAGEGVELVYKVKATDPDLPWGDSLLFADDSLLFVIDPFSGEIRFTPTNDHVGMIPVRITVSDEAGAKDSGTIVIQVVNANTAPRFVDEPRDKTVDEGQQFTLTLEAEDDDKDDRLTFSDDSPLFEIQKLDAGIARVAFTPGDADVGSWTITVTVTDEAGLTDKATFVLTVRNTNDAPRIALVDDQTATEDLPFSLQLEVSDPDLPFGDELEAEVDLSWLAVDAKTWLLTGTPTNDQVGTHDVMVMVTDRAGATTKIGFRLTVENVNDAPTITGIGAPLDGLVTDDRTVEVRATAEDVDEGDVVSYRWLEAGEELATGKEAVLRLRPGKHTITLEVKDKDGAIATKDVTVTVRPQPTGLGASAGTFLLLGVVLAAAAGVAGILLLRRRARKPPVASAPMAAPAMPAPPVPPPGTWPPGMPPWGAPPQVPMQPGQPVSPPAPWMQGQPPPTPPSM